MIAFIFQEGFDPFEVLVYGPHPMQKSAKIDFFTVEIADSTDLEIILKNLHALPADSEKRNEEMNDDWVRLIRGKMSEDGYLGDIMRISMG